MTIKTKAVTRRGCHQQNKMRLYCSCINEKATVQHTGFTVNQSINSLISIAPICRKRIRGAYYAC